MDYFSSLLKNENLEIPMLGVYQCNDRTQTNIVEIESYFKPVDLFSSRIINKLSPAVDKNRFVADIAEMTGIQSDDARQLATLFIETHRCSNLLSLFNDSIPGLFDLPPTARSRLLGTGQDYLRELFVKIEMVAVNIIKRWTNEAVFIKSLEHEYSTLYPRLVGATRKEPIISLKCSSDFDYNFSPEFAIKKLMTDDNFASQKPVYGDRRIPLILPHFISELVLFTYACKELLEKKKAGAITDTGLYRKRMFKLFVSRKAYFQYSQLSVSTAKHILGIM